MLDNKRINRSSNDYRALGLGISRQIDANTTNAVILYDYEVQGLGSSGLGFFALSIDGLSWVVS